MARLTLLLVRWISPGGDQLRGGSVELLRVQPAKTKGNNPSFSLSVYLFHNLQTKALTFSLIRRISKRERTKGDQAGCLQRELYTSQDEKFFVPSFLRTISENTDDSFRSILSEPFPGVYTFEMFQSDFCELLVLYPRAVPTPPGEFHGEITRNAWRVLFISSVPETNHEARSSMRSLINQPGR
ncbi:hypothetical protein ACFX11_007053 [Malus domestica]